MARKKTETSEKKTRNVTPKEFYIAYGENLSSITLKQFVDPEGTGAKKAAEAYLNEHPEVLASPVCHVIVGKAKALKRQIRL